MAADIIGIAMEQHFPAGMLGPKALTLDIRAYLVPHDAGLVLVDTGMDQSGQAIDTALADAGADWSDISHIVLTNGHPDHTGALNHVRTSAPGAKVFASALEQIDGTDPLSDGDIVGGLTAFATPGHTSGHLSLIDVDRGVVLVGDCLGVVNGELGRAPARFTSDAMQAELSLHRLLDLRGSRMLFAHGPEISRPWEALDQLLVESQPTSS
jgi:glyoxylase-like metal-dependent hydrolase (beta-lactamase superfamily II)